MKYVYFSLILLLCTLFTSAMEKEKQQSTSQNSPSRISFDEKIKDDSLQHVSRLESFISGNLQVEEKKDDNVYITFFDVFHPNKTNGMPTESIEVFNKHLGIYRTAAVNFNVRDLKFDVLRTEYISDKNEEKQKSISTEPDINERCLCASLARFLVFLENRDLMPHYVPDTSGHVMPLIVPEERAIRKTLYECSENRDKLRSAIAACTDARKKNSSKNIKESFKLPLYPEGIKPPSLIQVVRRSYSNKKVTADECKQIFKQVQELLVSKSMPLKFERQLSIAHMQL